MTLALNASCDSSDSSILTHPATHSFMVTLGTQTDWARNPTRAIGHPMIP